MTKKQMAERIVELERRVQELEARQISYHPPVYQPPYFIPNYVMPQPNIANPIINPIINPWIACGGRYQ